MRGGRDTRAADEPRRKRSIGRQTGGRPIGAWMTLVIGLAVTGAAAILVESEVAERDRALHAAVTDSAADILQDGLQVISGRLQALAAAITIDPDFTHDDFRAVTRAAMDAHLQQGAMPLIAIEWLPKIDAEQYSDVAAWAGARGVQDFRILERAGTHDLVVSERREVHFPILFQQPLVGRRSMIGFDYQSEPVRVDAMRRAAASARVAVSGPIDLYRAERDYGLALVLPVYETARWSGPRTDSDWEAVAGFAAVVVAASAMADHIVQSVDALESVSEIRIHESGGNTGDERVYPYRVVATDVADDWQHAEVRVADRYFRVGTFLALPPVHGETLMVAALGLLLSLALCFRERQREGAVAELRGMGTHLRQTEQEARRAKKFYVALMETAPEGVVVMDGEQQIVVEANDQACRLTGLTREQLLGVHPRAISAAEQPAGADVDTLVERYTESALAGERPVIEWIIERPDGRRVACEVRLSRLPDSDRGLVRASLIDITDRKVSEEKQRWMLEQLRRLTQRADRQREADRKEVAALIHDRIGQLITAMKLTLGQARKRLGADEATDGQVATRLAEVDGLADELLETARRIARELRPTLLDAGGLSEVMAEEVVRWSERTGITAETSLPEVANVPDETALALFRSLQEFLNNVARHADANRVMVWLKRDEGRLILSVHDDGHGFDTTKLDERESLGLFLVRERAAELGGQLRVTSRAETGTLVTLTLPLGGNQ